MILDSVVMSRENLSLVTDADVNLAISFLKRQSNVLSFNRALESLGGGFQTPESQASMEQDITACRVTSR